MLSAHSILRLPAIITRPSPSKFLPLIPRRHASTASLHLAALKTSVSRVLSITEEDIMRMFVSERKLNGDFVSKVSDMLWISNDLQFTESEESILQQDSRQHNQAVDNERDNGLLKLTTTKEWVSGGDIAPVNKKVVAKNWQDESDKRKKLNFLRYEALKRELLLLTLGVGTACTAYCLFTLSFQAAVSYASGVLFSCLYLRLLYSHADNISKEVIPKVFQQKKTKKIGIRSEDLKDGLEKTLGGSSMALSSPRLVIPAAIYGLWVLSQHFPNYYFDFQLVPAMFGFLAYKGGALIQVYRDNEDLHMIFQDDEDIGISS